MPRPRLTIRHLMLLVAFSGLVIGIVRLRRLSATHTAASAEYAQMANLLTEEGRTLEDVADAGGGAWLARWKGKTDEDSRDYRTEMRRGAVQQRAKARHYERLRDKYARLARYPWLFVEPDPPAPE